MNSQTLSNLNRYSFFIAFPGLVAFGTNISFIFFFLLFIGVPSRKVFFESTNLFSILILFFFFGAVLSVFDLNVPNELGRSIIVLPNFLYWSILVVFLINIRHFVDHISISKYIMWGLISSITYFVVYPSLPKVSGFVSPITLNTFAFLSICFAAPSAVYILERKGYFFAICFSLLIVVILLVLGRRAGVVLVFFSCFMAITFGAIKYKSLLIGGVLLIIGFLILQFGFFEELIFNASPRVYEFIYENDDISSRDRSLLTRKLMLEKAFLIFQEHPLTGIGLNNFVSYEVDLKGDFEGSKFVVNKLGMNEKSAHNSYAALLAEGGLFLIVPFLLVLFFNILQFVRSFGYRSQIQNAFYWSFIAMCFHLYFISAIVNVYAWFLIGIVTALSVQSQKGELKWSYGHIDYSG